MGIPKLWEIVDHAAESRSLLNLATIEGFKVNNRGLRGLVIGVDISIRINAITAALKAGGVLNPNPNLILEKIFYQLCNFMLAPIVFVFVFDGPGRPPIKRGTRVIFRESDSEFYQNLKSMIVAFGFHHHEAPGEAEAELAQLNANNDLDAIITEDSDSLVFGARCVIRTRGPSVQHGCLVYFQEAVENTEAVSLNNDALLLCALFLGGDYGPGISGAGPKIAHTLAVCGFGAELVLILKSYAGAIRDDYLANWRKKLQKELAENTSGMLDSRHPQLASRIPPTFPDIHIAELYLYPLTSKSPLYLGSMPNVASWTSKQPNITYLSSFCSNVFGWRGSSLLKKFNMNLWPGAAFKLISSPFVLHNADTDSFVAPYDWGNSVGTLLATKVTVLKNFKLKNYHPTFSDTRTLNIHRVRVSNSNFISMAGLVAIPAIEGQLISIPEVILAVAMRDPSLVSTSLTFTDSSTSHSDSEDGIDVGYKEILEIFDSDEEDLHKADGKATAEDGIIDLTTDLD